MESPLDQSHRDLITQDIHNNIMVEAAAGSGKTTSLVDRILTMIESGIKVQNIVAITFTVKAGEELKNRIRKKLKAALASRPPVTPSNARGLVGDVSTTTDVAVMPPDAPASLYTRALADLDSASIGTIHAFCLQIITRFSIAMKISPAVAIMTDQQLASYLHTLVTQLVQHLRTDPRIAPILMVLQDNPTIDLSNSDILELVNLIDANLLALQDVDFSLGIPSGDSALDALRDFSRRLAALDPEEIDKPELAEAITAYIAEFTAVANAAETDLQAVDHLISFNTKRIGTNANGDLGKATPRGNKWHVHITETFAIDDFGAYVKELKAEHTQPLFAQLLVAIRDYLVEKRQERITAGALTQSDVIQEALTFLRTVTPEVHQQLHEQYRHFLIDEFQDTDALQFEIFLRILSKHAAADTDLDKPQIEPGSLFIVGDPKQAIYHFRGGDLSTYLSVKEEFVSKYGGLDPAETSLSVNFRTLPSILGSIDAVFGDGAGLIDRGAKELIQPHYVPFDASPSKTEIEQAAKHTLPPLTLIAPEPLNPDDCATGKLNKPELLGIEATDIAKFILDTFAAQKTIPDEKLGVRPVRYRDFAVLCPTKTEIGYVREALTALSIPFVIEVKSQAYQQTEVIALLNLLRALAHPDTCTTNLVLALRSQLFGISDLELFEYKLWHKQAIQSADPNNADAFNYKTLTPDGPADSRVYAALQYCHQLAFSAQTTPVHQLIYKILEDRKQYQSFPALINTFGTVVQDALEFDATNGGDLSDYLAYIDSLADDKQNKEIVFLDDDYDAVSITNFHQSKGREWPVCIIAGARYPLSKPATTRIFSKFIDASKFTLMREKNPNDETLAAWNSPSTCEFKLGTLSTASHDLAQKCEDIINDAERARVLYVALTRAQYALVLTAHRPLKTGRDPEAFAYKLPQFMSAFEDAEKIESSMIEDPYVLRDELGIEDKEDSAGPLAVSLEDYLTVFESRKTRSQESSSIVISKHDNDVSLGYSEILPPKSLEQDLRAYLATIQDRPNNPAQFGTIMHRAIELSGFSLDPAKQEEALAKALDEAYSTPDDEQLDHIEDKDLLSKTLKTVLANSQTIVAARQSQEVYTELPLATTQEGKTISAYADLVFKNDDGTWTIADYKNSTSAASLTEYYRQLWAYKQIFEDATGYEVGKLVIIYCLGETFDLIYAI